MLDELIRDRDTLARLIAADPAIAMTKSDPVSASRSTSGGGVGGSTRS